MFFIWIRHMLFNVQLNRVCIYCRRLWIGLRESPVPVAPAAGPGGKVTP
jgi:hypothetical protein